MYVLITYFFMCFRMLIRFLPLLAVWIASSFAKESSANDAASAKRTPMGFQGMRGKKDLSASSERDELSKRDLLDVQVRYSLLKSIRVKG